MTGLAATLRGAFQEARANPLALAWEALVMFVNDAVWIVFWALFFREVGGLRGWDMDGIILLQAVLTTSGGLTLGVLANARRIGEMALGGEFDAVLSLPVRPLPYVLLRRVEPVNLGDVVFGLALFAVLGDPTPTRTAVFVLASLAATAVLTGFLVLTGSLAFFAGRGEGGELGFHAMLMLSAYPADIFSGAARAVLYSVVPAAFVATVPAQLVAAPDAADLAGLAAVGIAFAAAGSVAFELGLRRYASGSVWTRA